jgi:zinc transporter ZupT
MPFALLVLPVISTLAGGWLASAPTDISLFCWQLALVCCLGLHLGGLLTIWWVQSPNNAVVLLAVAAGFFLQMATSDFLPELRAHPSSRWYFVPLILVGPTLIYVANKFIGIH